MIKSSSGAMTTPLLSLPNGCLCCSARSDDFAAIQELVAQRGAFDYIILETTGVADPGVVAETFWQNEEWDADVRLDGVICVVDGMWGEKVSVHILVNSVAGSMLTFRFWLCIYSKQMRRPRSRAKRRLGRGSLIFFSYSLYSSNQFRNAHVPP
jgi:hypothetical protein